MPQATEARGVRWRGVKATRHLALWQECSRNNGLEAASMLTCKGHETRRSARVRVQAALGPILLDIQKPPRILTSDSKERAHQQKIAPLQNFIV